MTVALKFFTDELCIGSELAETVAVEDYLTRRIAHESLTLLAWDRPGPGLYKFWFCGTDGSEAVSQSRMTDKDISLAPWQVFLFNQQGGNYQCLKGSRPFRTVHLTGEYMGMRPGDPVEIIRIADMKVVGHAVVTAVKQTRVEHLNMDDVKYFLMLIGLGNVTLPLSRPGLMMPRILSDYYGTAIGNETEVNTIEMLPSSDVYHLNKTGPLQAMMDKAAHWMRPGQASE